MANQETQILDEVIVSSRRKMLTFGLTSLAGIAAGAFASSAEAASYTDADILNFALNLEYLEANFYYLAAFGTTIDVSKLSIDGSRSTANHPFRNRRHRRNSLRWKPGSLCHGPSRFLCDGNRGGRGQPRQLLLLGALGSSAVAQPAINLGTSFPALATAAHIPNGAASARMRATKISSSVRTCLRTLA